MHPLAAKRQVLIERIQANFAMMKTENLYSDAEEYDLRSSLREKTLAWIAHTFTATGAIWGLLAIIAISEARWIETFIWLGIAVVVDAFDGIVARRLQAQKVLPEFDGALLDNILDYVNYVFVPAYFLTEAAFLPASMRGAGAGLILLASAYQFCQSDAKTDDHYFKGFPSYWNIMVFYMFILNLAPWLNAAIVVVLSALVFVPIKYVYPSRTATGQGLTMALAGMWGVVNILLLVQYPSPSPWLIAVSLLYAVYYVGLSLYATWQTAAIGRSTPDA